MIQDLHSHSYYSFCGKDNPEDLIKAAIDGGIELFGFTDHNHGIGYGRRDARSAPADIIPHTNDSRLLRRYYDHINLLKEKYADKIKILRGIEVSTQTDIAKCYLPETADISYFDYCIVEHLYYEHTMSGRDIFSFAERCGCPHVGIAHTDMFGLIKFLGEDPYDYFKKMAERNIFWEMNVNYDSTHRFVQHQYMLNFFENKEQQDIVRRSKVRLSVGFDGHKVEDYLPDRIKHYCNELTKLGIKMAFED